MNNISFIKGFLGAFGVCPPCIDDDNAPNYLCDPCDSTVYSVARAIPADRLLVETDSPYLAPVPHRGKSNEPAYVPHVAVKLDELQGVGLDAVAAASTANFYRLFNILKD